MVEGTEEVEVAGIIGVEGGDILHYLNNIILYKIDHGCINCTIIHHFNRSAAGVRKHERAFTGLARSFSSHIEIKHQTLKPT